MRRVTIATVPLAVLAACGGSAEATPEAVAETYADLVYAAYDASVVSATEMQSAVDTFIADPTEENLEAAQQAWLEARDDYSPTEAFRFYDGPIDNPEDGPEGQINAWPMDEAYVDYVEGDPDAGIINMVDEFPEIDLDVLVSANEQGGETNISTGWHAIEFLLWGQDLSDDGPGARPVTDYVDAANSERRSEYLRLATEQLVTDLTAVRDAWNPEAADGYRSEFLAEPQAAVQKMLRGIGALSAGELAGERMAVAYETRDQEDEHSCFSDNTNADVLGNAQGVRMVYLAEMEGVDGQSLSDLVAEADPELDTTLRQQLDNSVSLAEGFPTTFDQMIQAPDDDPARTALLEAIEALEAQGESIARAARALGVTINLEI
jgi:putative iron-regulated protein